MRRKNNILSTLLSVLMVLTLTACLKTEELERNPDGAITFRVVSKKSTKAAADREEQTTNNLDAVDIQAWRTTDGTANESIFMKGTLSGGNAAGWEFSDGTIFWPRENLNFFATAPQGMYDGTIAADGLTIADQVITGNTDMVYAMNCNETRNAHVFTPVALNFRHALSQIVFRVSNTNPNLTVIIKGIRIVGIYDSGTLNIKNTTTDAVSNGIAFWTNHCSSTSIENIKYDVLPVFSWGSGLWGANELKGAELGGITPPGTPAETLPIFLLPQNLPTWTITENADKTYTTTGSARIEILCSISQAKNVSYEKADGTLEWKWEAVKIWPLASMPAEKIIHECAWVGIPLTNPSKLIDGVSTEIGWEPNKKYVYSLIFGEGGGYNPDSNKPSIVPVKFDISISNFTLGPDETYPKQ